MFSTADGITELLGAALDVEPLAALLAGCSGRWFVGVGQ
jgi:hypothetical protein